MILIKAANLLKVRNHFRNFFLFSLNNSSNQHGLQTTLSYLHSESHSSNFKFSIENSSQDKSISTQSQQNILDLNAVKSTMLFMDSNQLSAIVRINRVKNNLKLLDSSKESLFFEEKVEENSEKQPNLFDQFDKRILSITKYNDYLARGKFEDYQDYPIVKLTEICLKFIEQHQKQPHSVLYSQKQPIEHWKYLQNLIRKRMHNCSSKDYLKISYICLNAYPSIYKFKSSFIEPLISGLRKEIPLMEEQQLMQLFLAVSQNLMQGRTQWESSIRFSLLNFGIKNSHYKIQSPFFENPIIYHLHHQILQKIVKRYQNKFMNTELAIKEQELFKMLWWTQALITFRNQSIGHVKDNTNSNLVKNKFLVGFVNVLSSKFHPKLKKTLTHVIKGELRQIDKKHLGFKSVKELIRFLECLGLLRDFLSEEGRNGKIYEDDDEKGKEVRLRAGTWSEKSEQVNEIMKSILDYESVKGLIQNFFDQKKTQLPLANDSNDARGQTLNIKVPLSQFENKWKLIKILDECFTFNEPQNIPLDWYAKLIKEFRILQTFEKTHETIQQVFKQKSCSQADFERLVRMGQIQVNILFKIFNNHSHINKSLEFVKTNGEFSTYNNVRFFKILQGIAKTCFYQALSSKNFIENEKWNLIKIVEPKTISNMIKMEISMFDQENFIGGQTFLDGCVGLIVKYAQEILGMRHFDEKNHYLHYVRQLQFEFYNYFAYFLRLLPQNMKPSTLALKIAQIALGIFDRNAQAYQYLTQHSSQYKKMFHASPQNHFLPTQNFISSNNFKALASSHSLTVASKQRLLQGSSNQQLYSKETMLLGQFILMRIKQERKMLSLDQNILKLNKFFTQIKAFNQIRFYSPVTTFMACPQFLITIENKKPDQNNQSKQLLKGLFFLPKQKIMQKQLSSLEKMYKIHGIQLIVIEVNDFLNMHINERLQVLNNAIFGSKLDKKANHRPYLQKIHVEKIY